MREGDGRAPVDGMEGLPVDVLHALFKCCAMDARAVCNMTAACRAWRHAADADLWRTLVLRRWPMGAEAEARGQWRDVFFGRAFGRRLARARQESVDLSEALHRRLAPNAFSLHPQGWMLFTVGGKTFCGPAPQSGDFDQLASTGAQLRLRGGGPGCFSFVGLPTVQWDTDGEFLVVKCQGGMAAFRVSEKELAGGELLSCSRFQHSSDAIALAVGGGKLSAIFSKKRAPSQPRGKCGGVVLVYNLESGHTAPELKLETNEQLASVCWLPPAASSHARNGGVGAGRRGCLRLAAGTVGGDVLIWEGLQGHAEGGARWSRQRAPSTSSQALKRTALAPPLRVFHNGTALSRIEGP